MKKAITWILLLNILSACGGSGSSSKKEISPSPENPVTPETPIIPDQPVMPETPVIPTEPEAPIKKLPSLISLPTQALLSFDSGYTVSKVRSAKTINGQYIIASSFEGTILAMDYQGNILWKNALSGLLNNDIWLADIDLDGTDEIFVANADGQVYALNAFEEILWQFKASDTPMYSVTVIWHESVPYIVCGGYEMNLYYLNGDGSINKTIASATYSQEKSFGNPLEHSLPKSNLHITNFIRPLTQSDGAQLLAVIGTNNSMQTSGSLYLFEPLADQPLSKTKLDIKKAVGDFKTADIDGDGNDELLLGNSAAFGDANFFQFDPDNLLGKSFKLNQSPFKTNIDSFGYRIAQTEYLDSKQYFVLFGSRVLLINEDLSADTTEVLINKYSYNDMIKIKNSNTIMMASAQSGGSAIHLINTDHNDWKSAYENLIPPGKIAKILMTTEKIKSDLLNYDAPLPAQRPIYFLTESQKDTFTKDKILALNVSNPNNPIFLNNIHMPKVEDWDRSILNNSVYEEKRDGRKEYSLSQQEVLDKVSPLYDNSPGAAFWGGHGNDPYMYSLETHKKTFDLAAGKKTILIYPELEKKDANFAKVMEDLFYPLAEYGKSKNGQISIRTKHIFWQSNIYLPMWSKLVDGEYADQFIPSMEETTDKSMELSVAARVGLWVSGSVNEWGTRFARDNPSFDRMRQHSHQMLPNFALRQMIYHISNGATQVNNFPVDQEYMSLLWDLIDKGILFSPKREQLLHLSPVHLSMLEPNEKYLEDGNNVKWLTFYDKDEEDNNPMVFSRLNGSWPGAAVNEWDFSAYAAGVHDRRLNFLPTYANGLVLMTPAQTNADSLARGLLKDKLHPIYKDILSEHFSDGYQYFSKDKSQQYAANTYYQTIKQDIEDKARLLPITVSGKVAWTVAQTGDKTIRLTLIDGGYLNPDKQTATVTFNTITPSKVKDVLDNSTFTINDNQTTIVIPTGGFRFIDITLTETLQ